MIVEIVHDLAEHKPPATARTNTTLSIGRSRTIACGLFAKANQ
jgi:hypothetical protein